MTENTQEINQLVPVTARWVGEQEVNTVNARELHEYLEVKNPFSNWITYRIKDGKFTEGKDYLIIHKVLNKSSRGRPAKEYYISLDMAKHLCMIEKNDKGFQVRDYFIEAEKALSVTLTSKRMFLLNIMEAETELDRATAINRYEIGYVKPLEARVKEQTEELQEARPKVDYYNELVDKGSLLNLRTTAKELGVKQTMFIKTLIEQKYLYRDARNKLVPYAQHTPKFFVVKEFSKGEYAGVQTFVTPAGREALRLLFTGVPYAAQ